MRNVAVTVWLVMSSVWTLAQGQSEQPTFRSGVELIQLDVAVLDGQRRPVRGLGVADFTVLENGVPRPIRAFTAVDLPAPARNRPAEATWASAVPPDVATNQVAEQDGRLVIILMDRSIHYQGPTVTARKIALAAVEELGPNDLGALVSTSGGIPQTLTADRARLVKAINQRGDWSTESGLFPFKVGPDSAGPFGTLSDPRCLCGLCVLETITRISDAVRETLRRRKVLLFIGSGIIVRPEPSGPLGDVGCDRRARDARKVMFESLAVSNLTIHSVDPDGLNPIGPQTRTTGGGAMGGPDSAGPRQRLQGQMAETTELLMSQGSLAILPERTGGRVVTNTNDPDEKIPEIFRESEAYYVLGFERGLGATDARRNIEVKVGQKGAHVYAQRQYLLPPVQRAASGSPQVPRPSSLDEAISGLMPSAGAPLSMAVAAFAGAEGTKAVVRISIDAAAFARGSASVPLDIQLSAVDPTAKIVASARQTSTVGTTGPAAMNVETQLNLEPGDYEVRAAVADQTNGVIASVYAPILVPPFGSLPLALSDVVIATSSDAEFPKTAATTRRAFSRTDHVRAFVQIYQGTGRQDAIAPVLVTVRVLDGTGRSVHDQSRELTKNDFRNRQADCELAIPVADLPPGEYLLRIDAAAGKQTVSRPLRFVVRPL